MTNTPGYPLKIVRSQRKTYEIRILPNGGVEIRVPARATKAQVEQILAKKAAWIEAKRAVVGQSQAQSEPQRYISGERFLYLGEKHPLTLVEEGVQAKPLVFKQGFFLQRQAQPQAAAHFEKWYRDEARRIFNKRAALYAKRHGLAYGPLKLSSARTRWGSCGAKGSLNLNWRLVLAPLHVIDYVIVHELAHLRERNHSTRFWVEVEKMMPDYREPRTWLKENGRILQALL